MTSTCHLKELPAVRHGQTRFEDWEDQVVPPTVPLALIEFCHQIGIASVE